MCVGCCSLSPFVVYDVSLPLRLGCTRVHDQQRRLRGTNYRRGPRSAYRCSHAALTMHPSRTRRGLSMTRFCQVPDRFFGGEHWLRPRILSSAPPLVDPKEHRCARMTTSRHTPAAPTHSHPAPPPISMHAHTHTLHIHTSAASCAQRLSSPMTLISLTANMCRF